MALAVAADGRTLASAGADQTVGLWDTATLSRRLTCRGHGSPVWALAISPDGRWVASAGLDGSVSLWNAADGAPRAVLYGHRAVVRALAFSPGGHWLASAGEDWTVRLWDVGAGTCATALRAAGPLTSVCWLKSARLSVAGARGLYVLDVC
jgi:WD40 repeat protein